MSDRNIIGRKIKYLRKMKHLTQEELAAKLNLMGLNIDRSMISRIESQSREITDVEIVAIAKALKVSIDELFS